MIARSGLDPIHYDRQTLRSFALDELGRERDEVAEHLETCEHCQQQLETAALGDLSWEEVTGLLQDYEPARPHDSLDAASSAEQLGPDRNEPAPVHSAASFLEASEHSDSLGRFARYEIMEFLGRGGMGIVMRGYDPALDRHCAIKVLAPELASNGSARRRFSREAKSAAAVVHPHVVPIQNVDEHQGLPYLVMPVVEGQSLQRRVEQHGPLETIEVVRIASQVASGLAAAHDQGLVHRDIKPANILLENGVERVQITDFGLARAIDDASMTRSGVIAGTPQYMSPEQAHGDPVDHRSDLFSLGSVIYFMLSGHSPFRAETTMGVLNRIGNDQPRKLRSLNPDVPQWLETLVMQLLEKDREQRFQPAEKVAKLLGQWQAHLQKPEDVPPPQPIVSAGRRSPTVPKWLTAIGFGGLMVWLAIIIVIETGKGTITIDSEADNVPIVIKKSDQVVRRLTVGRDGESIRLWAGEYELAFGKDPERMTIENGAITLGWRGDAVVRIRKTDSSKETGGAVETEEAPTAGRDTATRRAKYTDPFQIGVTLGPADASRIPTYFANGFEVTKVASDSPAQRAGIEVGDILLAWEGHHFYGNDPNAKLMSLIPTRELQQALERIRTISHATMKFAVLDHRSGEVVEVSTAWGVANGSNKEHGLRVMRERKRKRAR